MELWLWTCVQPPSSRQKKNKKILAYDGTYATDFNYHSIDSIVQDAKKVAKESGEYAY